jgi:hypothetical protein
LVSAVDTEHKKVIREHRFEKILSNSKFTLELESNCNSGVDVLRAFLKFKNGVDVSRAPLKFKNGVDVPRAFLKFENGVEVSRASLKFKNGVDVPRAFLKEKMAWMSPECS